jgi:glutaryl-CoA dehydrogenase
MTDFLPLSEGFTDDERLVQDNVRRFVNENVLPTIATVYEEGVFPSEWIHSLSQLGLLGMTLPAADGGAGANYKTYGLVCAELERGDSGLRSFLSVQNALGIYPLYTFGSDAQKQKYIPALIAGTMISCFGLTEPESGSDPGSMRTVAKEVAGGWLLNGSKTWITNAPVADIAIVWANTSAGIRGFIVERGMPGFSTSEIKHKFSMRASRTGELFFRDCFIPNENLLPGSEKGLASALSCLTQARYGIAWGAMGAASVCYEIAREYTLTRHQFNKPLAAFQLVQKELVDMYTEIVKAHYLNVEVARQMDAGNRHYAMVSLAKRNACREALAIARSARNLLGGNGISLEYHVIRHLTNLETVFTYEGTDNIHTLIVGRELTGISSFG